MSTSQVLSFIYYAPCPCCHPLHFCPLPEWFLSNSCPPFSAWRKGRVMNSPVTSDAVCHAAASLWQDKERLRYFRWDETRLLNLLKSRGKFIFVKIDTFTSDKETMCQVTGSSREADYFSSAAWQRGTGLQLETKSPTFPWWSCWDASVL